MIRVAWWWIPEGDLSIRRAGPRSCSRDRVLASASGGNGPLGLGRYPGGTSPWEQVAWALPPSGLREDRFWSWTFRVDTEVLVSCIGFSVDPVVPGE